MRGIIYFSELLLYSPSRDAHLFMLKILIFKNLQALSFNLLDADFFYLIQNRKHQEISVFV
jgi:hypothetical protein